MITIETRDFGGAEIDETKIINFPEGLPGFETDKRFALLSPLGDGIYPMWLQSADNPGTCFIVFNPFEVTKSYTLSEAQLEQELGVVEDTAVGVFCLSIIPERYADTTINLQCPVIVNLDTLTAKQLILETEYPVRYPLFTAKDGGD
jgi:flagellar assembly factor FliW